jgi:quercetin dioxygenase-like cupin family protein
MPQDNLEILDTAVPPKATLEPHSHDYHDGTGIITVGNEKERVKAGDAVYIPTNSS